MNVMDESIKMWATQRGLHNADPFKQMLKVGEEFGELCQAMNKGMDDALIQEEIGDIYITLVILCLQKGFDIDKCIKLAYQTIRDRKGELRNGIYVKEEDLHD